MIRNLSYISKINKTKKEMERMLKELIINLKFEYDEKKNNIKYEEYYFSGIPIPKNIEFKDVTYLSLNLSWNIDININIIDNNKIKYKVEKKKDNEMFEQVYEGNDTNCFIENLIENKNYEFRICCCYNEINGSWTKNYEIKTSPFDSIILKESNRGTEFLRKIYEWVGYKKMELIYRGTRDGVESSTFHNKCDNQGPTICLYKNEKGNIFGGCASISWTTSNKVVRYNAPESFLFTLTNIYNIEPTKFPSKNDQKEVLHYYDYGPSFGYGTDLGIYSNFVNQGAWTNFPNTFKDILGKGKSIFTGDLNKETNTFKIMEIEVFKLYK